MKVTMKQFSEQDQEALLDVLRRHEEELNAFRGVHYVDVGYKFVNGYPTDELAIRVHVGDKRPESELEAAQVLPRTIEGIPIDVIQSNPGLEQDREGHFDPLVGGIAVRNTRRSGGGTLGAIVFDADTRAPMGISNHHVLVGDVGRVGDNITSPPPVRRNNIIGTLTRWNMRLDCAVFTLNNSRMISREIIDFPQGVRDVVQPVVGMAVTKSGRRTGTTSGIVEGVSRREFTIMPDPRRPSPNGEISDNGDSGSVWLEVGSTNAVGLHYAGETSEENPERAWAKRMVNVMTALSITFEQ